MNRYRIFAHDSYWREEVPCSWVADNDGDWVRVEDVEKLERELAEAHAALRDLAHELHDAALARNKDELWEWGRDSTQLDLLQRHGDAIRAAQEDKP